VQKNGDEVRKYLTWTSNKHS